MEKSQDSSMGSGSSPQSQHGTTYKTLMPSYEEDIPEKPILDVRLLGTLQVLQDDTPIEFKTHKAKNLFAYLAFHRDTLHTREKLGELLWPNTSKVKQQKNFKTALWLVRDALQDQQLAEPYIYADRQLAGVSGISRHHFHVDTSQFTQLIDHGLKNRKSEFGIRSLEKAVSLYRSDFLEDIYNDWCLSTRERFRFDFSEAVKALRRYYTDQGEYAQAILWGINLWKVEPYCEETLRNLMILHAQRGQLNKALNLCLRFAERLETKHGVGLQKETVNLYHKLREKKGPPVMLSDAGE